MSAPENFLSFAPYRKSEWKGHETVKNVRNVIRCNEGRRAMRIFALSPDGIYWEVPFSEWDSFFAGSA